MMTPQETYRTFARYYDLYVRSFDADLEFYRQRCRKKDSILEIGCGTGRILQDFLQHGFDVTGVDISDEMLTIAREKFADYCRSGQLYLKNHNFLERALPEKYMKVLITFYTFNYIFDTPERFLGHVRQSMVPGATLFIDVFEPKTRMSPELDNVWQEHTFTDRGRTIVLKDRRHFDGESEERTQIFLDNTEEIRITTRRKYYAPAEMRMLLEEEGFTHIRFSGVYDVEHFTEELTSLREATHYVVQAQSPG